MSCVNNSQPLSVASSSPGGSAAVIGEIVVQIENLCEKLERLIQSNIESDVAVIGCTKDADGLKDGVVLACKKTAPETGDVTFTQFLFRPGQAPTEYAGPWDFCDDAGCKPAAESNTVITWS